MLGFDKFFLACFVAAYLAVLFTPDPPDGPEGQLASNGSQYELAL